LNFNNIESKLAHLIKIFTYEKNNEPVACSYSTFSAIGL
jgi:hypothetical protein